MDDMVDGRSARWRWCSIKGVSRYRMDRMGARVRLLDGRFAWKVDCCEDD